MGTVFFTGFPGFLGAELLPRVLARAPRSRAVCLVQERWLPTARRTLAALGRTDPSVARRTEFVVGDITQPNLGLAELDRTLARSAEEIFHLAAVYDLSVPRDVGWRVNVEGTRNLLSFASWCAGLERLHYVSTCYVSGRFAGTFRESDLSLGQTFNNFYEETKYHAEVAVAEAVAEGLPATIYRPSIVVGDSTTGQTQKYDGPYYALQLLLRQPRLALMPQVGDPDHYRMNVVPRDFVVDAIAALSALPDTAGQVFALADPQPLTVREMIDLFADVTGRRVIPLPTTRGLATFALDRVPGVRALVKVPPSLIDYLTHPTHYETARTTPVLARLGVTCPTLPSYAERLVAFRVAHPEITAAAMT